MANTLNFELVSPEALVLSGQASEVVVPGSEGYFTVMANHAPFMSTVKPGVVAVKLEDGELKNLFVRGGFADVSPAGFTLLAEEATAIEDLDITQLETQIANAKEDVADADTHEKRATAQAALAQLEEALMAVKAIQ